MSVGNVNRVAVIAAGAVVVASLGVAVAQAEPVFPVPESVNCPMGDAFGGVQYAPDPANQNAYYVCAGGLPQQHLICPASTALNMSMNPPTCVPWRAGY